MNIYTHGPQGWAVFGLIFISGAVLEYHYQGIESIYSNSRFMIRRAIHLYPAFWMCLLFGLIIDMILSGSLAKQIIANNWFFLIFEYTGFYVILGKGPGFINMMGWFIAAIISLYILYPYLLKFIRKYQLPAVVATCAIRFSLRSILFSYNAVLPDTFAMWFPFCNIFEFCLGIYVIQNSLYPKNSRDYALVHEVAELSFYVFLFHAIIIQTFSMPFALPDQYTAIMETHYLLWYLSVELPLIIVALCAMVVDRKIQQKIRKGRYT